MRKVIVMLLLAGAIGSVYYNALNNGFVFDDYLLIVQRTALPQIASHPRLALSLSVVGYRPLRTLSYVLDYRIGGMQPWIFHLSNLIYHWLTACLVFLVTWRLVANAKAASGQWPLASLSDAELRTPDSGLRPALFAAFLWALHPIQTDAVSYISGRRDILAGFFFFLGFYAFLRLRTPDSGLRTGGRVVWAGVAFVAYGLGLLSKEMAVTLPLVILCYDYVCTVRLQGVRFGRGYIAELVRGMGRTVWEHKYLYLPLFLGGAWFSWHAAFVVLPTWRIGWYGGSIGANFLTVARIWVYYLYLLLWPVHLLADYTGAFAVTRSLRDPWALAAVSALLGLLLVTLGMLRSSRLTAFAALWMAISLLPVSHIIPYPEMMAEHYLYIPSFGFCLLVALALTRLTRSPKSEVRSPKSEEGEQVSSLQPRAAGLWRPVVGYGLLAGLLIFYAGRTISRNRDWRDDLTLFNCVVRDNPASARARLGLGYAYDRIGLPRMAIVQYETGLRLDPQDPRLYTNLGAAHQKLGELREAERVYIAALKLRLHDLKVLNNLGFLYVEKKEFDKARSILEKAEQLSSGRNPTVYANFGLLYEVQNKVPEALAAYQKAIKLDPYNDVYAQRIAVLEKYLAKQNPEAGEQTEKGQQGAP
jgi:protein O-mannosyl-transferase